jgi:CheY-like chemotaxis protein
MKYRVLLVDDQPAVRGLVTLELERMEFTVTSAATGQEALLLMDEWAKAAPTRFPR